MSIIPLPFPFVCQDSAAEVLEEITTISLKCDISGSVIVDEEDESAGCTPDPRPVTLTVTGSQTTVWTRKAVHGLNTAPADGEFSIFRFACATDPGFQAGNDANSTNNGTVTCSAPEVTCTSPPSTIPAYSDDTDFLAILYLSISRDFTPGIWVVEVGIFTITPNISCGVGGNIDFVSKLFSGLTFSEAFTNRSGSVSIPLGDGNIDFDFDLIFA